MLYEGISFFNLRFENDVKEYGIQTIIQSDKCILWFENDVKEYGIQTNMVVGNSDETFENDVKEYGIQTWHHSFF